MNIDHMEHVAEVDAYIRGLNLRNCPVCGQMAEPQADVNYATKVWTHWIECSNENDKCACWPRTRSYPTWEEAAKVWNSGIIE